MKQSDACPTSSYTVSSGLAGELLERGIALARAIYYNVFDLVITLHLSYVLYDTSSTTRMIDHLSAAGNLNLQQRDYSSTTVIIL